MFTLQPSIWVHLIPNLFVRRDLSLESTFNLYHGKYILRHVPCLVGGFKCSQIGWWMHQISNFSHDYKHKLDCYSNTPIMNEYFFVLQVPSSSV